MLRVVNYNDKQIFQDEIDDNRIDMYTMQLINDEYRLVSYDEDTKDRTHVEAVYDDNNNFTTFYIYKKNVKRIINVQNGYVKDDSIIVYSNSNNTFGEVYDGFSRSEIEEYTLYEFLHLKHAYFNNINKPYKGDDISDEYILNYIQKNNELVEIIQNEKTL